MASTVDDLAEEMEAEEMTSDDVYMDPEEQRLRQYLADDDMRSHQIERRIAQSKIWHAMYHNIEMQHRDRLRGEGLNDEEIDRWINEHRRNNGEIVMEDYVPVDTTLLEHVYSSEEGSKPSTASSGTFGYDPDDFPPDSSDDINRQEDDAGFMAGEAEGDKMTEEIWLGDTGASSHMTMSLKGM